MPGPQILEYNQRALSDILDLIKKGKLVLPYFQRDYVWKVDQARKLLSSLFTGLPMGSTLVIVGDEDEPPQFVYRVIEGVPVRSGRPKYYLLDGQQRLTSLYSVFADLEDLSTSKTRLNGRWFLRLEELLYRYATETTDQVFARIEPEELEPYFEQFHRSSKPALFDQTDIEDFLKACQAEGVVPLDMFWPYDDERRRLLGKLTFNLCVGVFTKKVDLDPNSPDQMQELMRLSTDTQEYIAAVLAIKIPSIEFKTVDFQKAIQAFEIVNTGGTKLHTFDLLVARAGRAYTENDTGEDNASEKAVDDFHEVVYSYIDPTRNGSIQDEAAIRRLDSRYDSSAWDLSRIGVSPSTFDKTAKDQVVNFLTLFGSDGHDIKNTYFFKLNVGQAASKLVTVAPVAMTRFVRTMAFLNLRCGMRLFKSLPYKLITLPLAMALDDSTWQDKARLDRLEAWFWTVTLSGRYMTAQSERTRFEVFRVRSLLGGIDQIETRPKKDTDFEDGVDDRLILDHVLDVPRTFESILGADNYPVKSRVMRKALNAKVLSEVATGDGVADIIGMFLLRRQAHDFVSGASLTAYDTSLSLHDHHIVPLGSAASLDESTRSIRKDSTNPRNSVLNRTLITASTNSKISSKSPAEYFKQIQPNYLREHFIPFATQDELRQFQASDDREFNTFIEKRHAEIKHQVVDHVRNLLST